ncbi:hypothetical protein PAXRUDRAFT_836301 [Paxillus rubicundulus Ve08.2h10]|uniref:Uncharacterized protein n=1 Tax=Paxillus rubicundulus Ve08.2h10 TaxID=930991 RepID=A0A0D0D875_9AGAM|nr:hypothetical protein PAXRUDRAFT_836301 [Paxillus rubicundulus Ve08.2h10]
MLHSKSAGTRFLSHRNRRLDLLPAILRVGDGYIDLGLPFGLHHQYPVNKATFMGNTTSAFRGSDVLRIHKIRQLDWDVPCAAL